MALLFRIIFKIAYYGTTVIFPAYKSFESVKNNRVDRLWIDYFFMMGLIWMLNSTLLYPIILVLNLISSYLVPVIILLFAIWMIHPEYQGALYIEQSLINYLEFLYLLTYPYLGKILGVLGVPERALPQKSTQDKKSVHDKDVTSQERISSEKEKSM